MMERKMHWRRLAALVLCLCSVLSILPLPARAEETTAETAETAETQAPAETVEETQETQAAEPEQTEEAEIVTEETEPTMARPMPRPVGPVLTAQSEDLQAQAQTFLENALPEDAALAMTVLREEEFENCWAQVEAALETPLTQALFFDLRLLSGETEVEPAAGTVTVKVTLPQELEAGFVDVVHFKETYVARLDAQVEGTTVTFQTDSFSRFGVIVRESRVPDGGWATYATKANLNVYKADGNYQQFAVSDDKTTLATFLNSNSNVIPPDVMDTSGYPTSCFLGWKNDKNETKILDLNTQIRNISKGTGNNPKTYSIYPVFGDPATLTFDLGDAANQVGAPELPAPVRVHPGYSLSQYTQATLSEPSWTKADGTVMQFDGWFTALTGGTQFDVNTAILRDMTVYAHWTEPHVTVTFDLGEAKDAVTALAPATVKLNGYLTLPQSPVWEKDGQAVKYFDGWYTDSDCTEKFSSTQPVGEEDFTLYAKWLAPVTVSFDLGEAGEAADPIDPIVLRPGGKLELPEDPVWDEKPFAGWYLDENFQTAFDPGNPIMEDTTLYARWAVSVTVTFSMGESMDGNAPPSAPKPMTVLQGTTGLQLPYVKWLGEDGPLYMLDHWYYLDENQNEVIFTAETPVDSDMTLYASWVAAEGSDIVTVSFHFTEGIKDVVVMTRQVLKGQTVQDPAGPIAKDRLFQGWSKTEQKKENYEDDTVEFFKFNMPITENLHLYAWYSEICTVTFEMNGGNPIPPLILAKGGKISEETLTEQAVRYGYELVQWTTDPENQTPFDFEKAITESMTLYADWRAVMAQVHIVELFEDANQDIYNDPAEVDHRIVWAPVGSYVNVKDLASNLADAARYNAEHDIVYSTTPLAAGVETEFVQTKDPANPTASTSETGKIRDSREDPTIQGDSTHYFQYLRSSTDAKVRPDGSTTLYVYYRRVRVTLKFNFPGTETEKPKTDTVTFTPNVSDADRLTYAVPDPTYEYNDQNETIGFTYELTAKYKQQIGNVWPKMGWIDDHYDASSNPKMEFYGWLRPDSVVQTTLMHTMESALIDTANPYFENGQLFYRTTLNPVGRTGRLIDTWLLYILDTLPDEKPDFSINGVNYTVRSNGAQVGYINTYFRYKAISIGKPIYAETIANVPQGMVIFNQPYEYSYNTKHPELTSTANEMVGIKFTATNDWGITGNTTTSGTDRIKAVSETTIKGVFDNYFKGRTLYDSDTTIANINLNTYCTFQILPYKRNPATLTLHPYPQLNNDTYKVEQQCRAEERIFDNKDAPYADILLKFNDKEDGKWIAQEGYSEYENTHRFVGWYTTPSFSKGTEFFPNADSRILTSMELYAKWEPVAFQAQYHVLDETHEEGFEEGDYLIGYPLNELPNLTFSEELEKNFIGWYWYSPNDPDTLVPFNFDQPVGENFTQDGVLHLYAQFDPVSSKVIYHRGDNEELDPESYPDGTNYSLDTACQLKQPDDVWSAADIEATNKKFLGWERNGKYYRPGQHVVITAPTMDFTALWADNPIQLIYNANKDVEEPDVTEWMEKEEPHPVWNNMDVNPNYQPDDPASQWIPHFTWEGHKLLGWSRDPDGPTEDSPLIPLEGATITPKEGEDKITLYAVWETQVTITYHPNSLAATPQDTHQTSHSPGSTVPAWDNKVYGGDYFTNEGYIFLGWSTEEGVHDVTYARNALIDLSKLDENNNLNLYAQWRQDESAVPRVVYHSNYQDAGMTEQEKIDIGEYRTSTQVWRNTTDGKPAFEKPGYVFLGWSQRPNANVPDTDFAAPWVDSTEDKPDHAAATEIYFDPDAGEVIDYYAVWGPMPDIQVQVKKLVEGSLGDTSKSFSFTMTYPKSDGATETKNFALQHDGESEVFSVPKGATLTIMENDANDYTMTCDRDGAVNDHTATVKLPAEAPSGPYVITITNKKDPTPDTGVSFDSLPALILLAVSVLGGGALLLRRRRYL